MSFRYSVYDDDDDDDNGDDDGKCIILLTAYSLDISNMCH